MQITKQDNLDYHFGEVPGKISIKPTKPCHTAKDLSMAYTPGVADPVLEIAKNQLDAMKYTNRQNLVAVVSNGSAILGLGNLGALASKPVMEGKAVLFKRFADIDVFDIELDTADPNKIIETVKLMEPTFGGINLEDIKAPECFEIEKKLKEITNIPIFHDDQHGTAIITAAGLLNYLEITEKSIDEIRVVVNGAGAAGIACADLIIQMGVKKENVLMCDSKGVISDKRDDLNSYKKRFQISTQRKTLADAMEDSDVFIGVSAKDVVDTKMLLSMKNKPAVFAMANPDPEIRYELATKTRKDLIMATGRSDYPNQINNVLGFPFIFRGALDVMATDITENMKIAAAKSLAALAKEPVSEIVKKAYGNQDFSFGPEYIVPKPFDPRVIEWEAVAVAKAAMDEKIAHKPISDLEKYRRDLVLRMKKYWIL